MFLPIQLENKRTTVDLKTTNFHREYNLSTLSSFILISLNRETFPLNTESSP